MGYQLARLNQELKRYDRNLLAQVTNTGMVQVWRQADKWEASELGYEETGKSVPMQFIFALTDNWGVTGKPIEIGIEPVMTRVREMDLWSKVSFLDDLRKSRERVKATREQSRKNEIRDIAKDLRKDFAEVTNDINTSTVEKVDSRRNKYGNC